ncbi:MAG: hypothetical protein AMXMBFR33_16490 [Candidatus Xenobia bacterium]
MVQGLIQQEVPSDPRSSPNRVDSLGWLMARSCILSRCVIWLLAAFMVSCGGPERTSLLPPDPASVAPRFADLSPQQLKKGKVTVCHHAGNGQHHLISISEPALDAHLSHGDQLPPCPGGTSSGGDSTGGATTGGETTGGTAGGETTGGSVGSETTGSTGGATGSSTGGETGSSTGGDTTGGQTTGGGSTGGTGASDVPSTPVPFYTAVHFLVEGDPPVQTDFVAGSVRPGSAAVLRGRVLDGAGAPLAGARVEVHGHAEWGSTISRADGAYDLLVEGGQTLRVHAEHPAAYPAQRTVRPAWQDYCLVADIALIDRAPATRIVNNASVLQVVTGDFSLDARGFRRPLLMVLPGTSMELVLPDGQTQTTAVLDVETAEYTAGPDPLWRDRMPASLPRSVGPTYCLELSAAQIRDAEAETVRFSKPATLYLENFLGLDAGLSLPQASYSFSAGAWQPGPDGWVVRVVAEQDGLAQLDFDGDSVAETQEFLDQVGVTADEQRELISRGHSVGSSLWRLKVSRFSPFDCNLTVYEGRPPNITPNPCLLRLLLKIPCPELWLGASFIDVHNQVFGESLGLVGTPFSLNYASERTPGSGTDYSVPIRLSGPELPLSPSNLPIKRIKLTVIVAGRQFVQEFPGSPNQSTTFTWDGLDVYGRRVQGRVPATIKIDYVSDGLYVGFIRSGPDLVVDPVTWSRFNQITRLVPTGYEVSSSGEYKAMLGTLDTRGKGLGGWTPDVYHSFDPTSRILYKGDGTRECDAPYYHRSSRVEASLTPYGGGGGFGDPVCFGDAVVTGSGDLVYGDLGAHVIVRRAPGQTSTSPVAGTGAPGLSGDGGPAQLAQINAPTDLEMGHDGSLYFVDAGNRRIRRISPQGVITTVAGNGEAPSIGPDDTYENLFENQDARLSAIQPGEIALAPDGTLYFVHDGYLVMQVSPNGILQRTAGRLPVAGSYSGDGSSPLDTDFDQLAGLTVDPNGHLLLASGARILKLDGLTVTTVAGTGVFGAEADEASRLEGPALAMDLMGPRGLEFHGDSLYFTDGVATGTPGEAGGVIRLLHPDGLLRRLAGGGSGFPLASAPLKADLDRVGSLEIGPDGGVYVGLENASDCVIMRINGLTPQSVADFPEDHLEVPSHDATMVYQFDASGLHMSTRSTLTGALLYTFSHDSQGRLSEIVTGDGELTRFEHDSNGAPTAVVSHDGQRTTLSTDSNGFLASASSPAGRTVTMASTPSGLLTSLRDPNQNAPKQLDYDAAGRLERRTDPAGNQVELTRTETEDGFEVRVTDEEDRQTRYLYACRDRKRRDIQPDGTEMLSEEREDGDFSSQHPDGTLVSGEKTPDPRFGLAAPYTSRATVTSAGRTAVMTATRSVVLSDQADPFSLTSLTETSTFNARTSTSHWNAVTRTLTTTSPAGRTSVSTHDAQGRVLTSSVPGLATVTSVYDTRGRLTSQTAGSGPEARTSIIVYGADGFAQSLTDALSRTVSFARDADGLVNSTTGPDGRVVSSVFDANGNLTSLTPPGRPAHTFTYDNRDLNTHYTPPTVVPGGPTEYTYNRARQPLTTLRPDGDTATLVYDAAGRPQSLTLPRGSFGYGYEPLTGRLQTVSAPGGFGCEYTYDQALLASRTLTGPVAGTVSWDYDSDFRTSSRSVNGANSLAFAYDADDLTTAVGGLALGRDAQNGLLTSTTLGSVADALSYNLFGEVTGYSASSGATPLYSESYVRDALGRITERTEVLQGVTTVWGYGYDTAGRLASVTRNGAAFESYTYDSNDNRLTKTTAAGTTTYAHDDQDRLLSAVGPDGAESWIYDANGDLLSHNGSAGQTSFDYETGGQLLSLTRPDGDVVGYELDAGNKRAVKRVNGVVQRQWVYAGGLLPVAELDGSGNLVAVFNGGFMVKNGTTYRLLRDHLGSVRMVVDASTGTVVQRLSYGPWGEVLEDTNPGFQPFGFAGGLYDADTGLVRFGARDYDPSAGRWTCKDPIGLAAGANVYAYCGQDPINCVDPSGLEIEPWTKLRLEIGMGLALDTMRVLLGPATADLLGVPQPTAAAEPFVNIITTLAPVPAGKTTAGTRLVRSAPCPEFVMVYHGSINDATHIRTHGLDPARLPTWLTTDRAAAHEAISSARYEVNQGLVRDTGVIESRIPRSEFERTMLPHQRPYVGFSGHLDTTEIVIRRGFEEAIGVFNSHILR